MTISQLSYVLSIRYLAYAAAFLLAWHAPALYAAVQPFQKDSLIIVADGKPHIFTVELAQTPQQQARGLMFREVLAADAGMLFTFTPDIAAAMWMKNTLIPLDMLFIDKTGIIRYIAASTKPNSTDIVTAGFPVRAVLELRGGICETLGVRTGDRVLHGIFKSGLIEVP